MQMLTLLLSNLSLSYIAFKQSKLYLFILFIYLFDLKIELTGLITEKRNYYDISNTLNVVAASRFQDTFFSR